MVTVKIFWQCSPVSHAVSLNVCSIPPFVDCLWLLSFFSTVFAYTKSTSKVYHFTESEKLEKLSRSCVCGAGLVQAFNASKCCVHSAFLVCLVAAVAIGAAAEVICCELTPKPTHDVCCRRPPTIRALLLWTTCQSTNACLLSRNQLVCRFPLLAVPYSGVSLTVLVSTSGARRWPMTAT